MVENHIEKTSLPRLYKRYNRLFLGEGVFETMLVKQRKIVHADLHWQRMSQSALFLGIPFALSLEEWMAKITALVKQEGCVQGVIKVILFPIVEERGLVVSAQESEIVWQFFEYSSPANSTSLLSLPWYRDSNNPLYRHKTLSYLENIHAKRYAQKMGKGDVIIFDQNDYILETSCSNIFLIIEDVLYTPSTHLAILPGIERQVTIDKARRNGIACKEACLTREHLYRASAVFVTNSLVGLLPVYHIDNTTYNLEHPIYQLLKR